jgi:zinc transporter
MLARETRPRAVARDDALLVNLRGVNLNPGAEPDDMIGLRVELEGKRVITVRRRKLKAIRDLQKALKQGRGPTDTGDFLIDLIDALLRRMATAFEALDARIDAVQERTPTDPSAALRSEISEIRNQVISLRRYLAPQREAVSRLQIEKVSWLNALHRERLRELADRTMRRVEDLEEARDRAGVAHEELTSRMAERMNQTMYILAIVAAVFLPLGLITGLLGINVGGMPGADDSSAFWIVCAMLVVLAGLQMWLFKKRRWL